MAFENVIHFHYTSLLCPLYHLDFTTMSPHSFIDPNGCWWPPSYPIWTLTTVSFSFSVSLIIAQFTIFSSFSGPKLPDPFWGPKRHFLGSPPPMIFLKKIVFSIVVLGKIFPTGYHARQTEIIRPIRDPGNLAVQLTPKRGPQFGVSSSRVRFWNVKGFPLFLNNK